MEKNQSICSHLDCLAAWDVAMNSTTQASMVQGLYPGK